VTDPTQILDELRATPGAARDRKERMLEAIAAIRRAR
jgi:hypothetical protein